MDEFVSFLERFADERATWPEQKRKLFVFVATLVVLAAFVLLSVIISVILHVGFIQSAATLVCAVGMVIALYIFIYSLLF